MKNGLKTQANNDNNNIQFNPEKKKHPFEQ